MAHRNHREQCSCRERLDGIPDCDGNLEITLRLAVFRGMGGDPALPQTNMGAEIPAEGFLRHRGLILTAVGGAVVEGGLLTLLAPNARSVAPQATALPSIAAYHDLRWLFTDTQSWLWFAGLMAAVLVARAALDATMLRLAWPRDIPAPLLSRSFVSCAALISPQCPIWRSTAAKSCRRPASRRPAGPATRRRRSGSGSPPGAHGCGRP